ncbi:MAG: TIR domain-containing protein [Acidobacteriota bacterium]
MLAEAQNYLPDHHRETMVYIYGQDYNKRGLAPRARQNVILETGMLLSSLTRECMAIGVQGHVAIPSDRQGLIRLGYNDHVKETDPKLCQRLKEVGFDLQPEQIAAATQ